MLYDYRQNNYFMLKTFRIVVIFGCGDSCLEMSRKRVFIKLVMFSFLTWVLISWVCSVYENSSGVD